MAYVFNPRPGSEKILRRKKSGKPTFVLRGKRIHGKNVVLVLTPEEARRTKTTTKGN